MSGFRAILDEDGNINTEKLTQELKSALDYDVRYKQTDNMKKRAIKTATNYDEFKAMVACAHLKKISRKEVESLSEVKKGWKKGNSAVSRGSEKNATLLEREIDQARMRQQCNALDAIPTIVKEKGKKKEPKTCMELERDLRRLTSPADKRE